MKVKYVGTAREIMIPGIGIINPGDVIEVSPSIGETLVRRTDFVEVIEEADRQVERPEESETSLLSSFTLTKGGESEEWEPDMSDSE